MTDKVAVWTPSKFDGSDLLPVQAQAAPPADIVGRENVAPKDLKFPELKLMHGISKEVTAGTIPGVKPGLFLLTSTSQVLRPPLRLLLVHHSRSRALFEGDGLEMCLSKDGANGTVYGVGPDHECEGCEHEGWQNDEPPKCDEANNFVALTPHGPARIRFKSSSYKAGANIVDKWNNAFPAKNLFAHPVILTVRERENKKGQPYYYLESHWDQSEDVPPELQTVARALLTQIQAAHETGRFSGDEFDD